MLGEFRCRPRTGGTGNEARGAIVQVFEIRRLRHLEVVVPRPEPHGGNLAAGYRD
jgi:hypothetical protein